MSVVGVGRAIPPVRTLPQSSPAPSLKGKWSSDLIFSTLKHSNEFDSQNDLLTQPAERVFEGRYKPLARQCDIFLSSASCLFLSTPGQLIINEIFARCCFHACSSLSPFPRDREVSGLYPTPTSAAFAGELVLPGRPRLNHTSWLPKAWASCWFSEGKLNIPKHIFSCLQTCLKSRVLRAAQSWY